MPALLLCFRQMAKCVLGPQDNVVKDFFNLNVNFKRAQKRNFMP